LPTTLSSDDISAPNTFGIIRFVRWDEINRVKLSYYYGLYQLKCYSSRLFFPILIPMYHREQSEFMLVLTKMTLAGSAIDIYLSEKGA
jgi:hypothetical protein